MSGEVTVADFPAGRWRARWIWSRAPSLELRPGGGVALDQVRARSWVLLRSSRALESVPARAPARMTADSRYVLWLNGTELARGPVRAHPQRLHYDLVDLAPHLRSGPNTLAVLARCYGDATPWWMPSTPTYGLGGGAFLMEAHLGDGAWWVSDGSWRCVEPPAWSDAPAAGAAAMKPELCDGRHLPARWQAEDFDDSGWAPAVELRTHHTGWPGSHHPPSPPYGPLHPRPIPQLTGALRQGRVVATALAPGDGRERHGDPVSQVGADEAAAGGLERLLGPRDTLAFSSPPASGDGAWLALVDFGEQVSGHVTLEIEAEEGTCIDAKAAEAVDARGRLEALQQHSGFRYLCRGDADRFETFDTIGLRYLTLSVRSPAPVVLRQVAVAERLFARDTFTSRSAGAREDVPFFACSDPLLDRIWTVGRRTVDLCSHDAYLDCPSREQRAWTGDAVVHGLVDLTTNLDWSLAVHNLSVGASPRPDGMLPMAAAGDIEWRDDTIIPDWALHWVHALWNVHRYTGRRDLLRRLLPVAERVLHWFCDYQAPSGLLEDVGGWVLIDWAAVSTTGASGALNALFARALREFAELSRALGDEGRARWAEAILGRLGDAFEAFWDPDRRVYVDHLVAGSAGRPLSQHTNAAAIAAGLAPGDRVAGLVEAMLDHRRLVQAAWLVPGREATLQDAGDMYAGVGYLVAGTPDPWWDVERGIVAAQPFFRYVVHDAVAAAGRADLLPALCRDWTRLLGRSEKTWSEVWYGGSRCHAWCATPTRDLMQYTLGVRPARPGFAEALVEPVRGDLEWVRGAVPTPAGLLRLEVASDEVTIDAPLPVILSLAGWGRPGETRSLGPGRNTIRLA